MDKEPGFAVAYERQDPDILLYACGCPHEEDEPAIWRPACGNYERFTSLCRQQQLPATGVVGILLVNALVPAEHYPAPVWRPGRTGVVKPRIVGERHLNTARQFIHPDISGRNTCLECELCSIR